MMTPRDVWMVIGVVALCAVGPSVQARADAPLVEVGKHYTVVWSCLKQIGCYAEQFRVEKVRTDGWVDVFQCAEPECRQGERWVINLAQAMSLQQVKVGRAAN